MMQKLKIVFITLHMRKIAIYMVLLIVNVLSASAQDLSEMLQLAEKGDSVCQYRLGELYSKGEMVKKDPKIAYEWYSKSADKGYPLAQERLGDCYREGKGVAIDLKRADSWYSRAARKGCSGAQYWKGVFAQEGLGHEKDIDIAKIYLLRAVSHGHVDAMIRLGFIYEYEDEGKNLSLAKDYYQRALNADNKNPKAKENLGRVKKKIAASKIKDTNSSDKRKVMAWYVFGTKMELKDQGIIQAGELLKGDYNPEYLSKIDINETKEIKLYSANAKILTLHPEGSYMMDRDTNNKCVLKILDPALFWSYSSYLVILVK